MKNMNYFFVISLFLFVINGCTQQQTVNEESEAEEPPSIDLTEDDIAELRNIASIQEQAGMAGDWDSWIATFTDDIVMLPPDNQHASGLEGARAFFEASPPISEFVINIEDISGNTKTAYSWGTAVLTLDIEGNSVVEEIKFLVVFEKQEDGSWKMSRDMWNSIAPTAE